VANIKHSLYRLDDSLGLPLFYFYDDRSSLKKGLDYKAAQVFLSKVSEMLEIRRLNPSQ